MSHDGSGRAACGMTICGPRFHFVFGSLARGVTDPGVGSGALLGVWEITVELRDIKVRDSARERKRTHARLILPQWIRTGASQHSDGRSITSGIERSGRERRIPERIRRIDYRAMSQKKLCDGRCRCLRGEMKWSPSALVGEIHVFASGDQMLNSRKITIPRSVVQIGTTFAIEGLHSSPNVKDEPRVEPARRVRHD